MKSHYITTKIFCMALFSVIAFTMQAQTAIFNQQWYSRVNRNPAAAATGVEALNLGLFYRAQWAGIDGAPTTAVVNADTYFAKIKSGIGLTMSYDQVGKSMSNINAVFSYAYRLTLSDEWNLSFGLAAGLMNMNNDPSKNQFANGNDTDMPDYKVNAFNPDFNAGLELSNQQMTVGLAVDHLMYGDAGTFDKPKTGRELYAYGRYSLDITTDFELSPQLVWNYFATNNTSVFDIGATATYKKMIWVGADWLINNAAAFMAGVEFSGIKLGYAYQMSIGEVGNLSKNTHELMLQIRINTK